MTPDTFLQVNQNAADIRAAFKAAVDYVGGCCDCLSDSPHDTKWILDLYEREFGERPPTRR